MRRIFQHHKLLLRRADALHQDARAHGIDRFVVRGLHHQRRTIDQRQIAPRQRAQAVEVGHLAHGQACVASVHRIVVIAIVLQVCPAQIGFQAPQRARRPGKFFPHANRARKRRQSHGIVFFGQDGGQRPAHGQTADHDAFHHLLQRNIGIAHAVQPISAAGTAHILQRRAMPGQQRRHHRVTRAAQRLAQWAHLPASARKAMDEQNARIVALVKKRLARRMTRVDHAASSLWITPCAPAPECRRWGPARIARPLRGSRPPRAAQD